MTPDLKFIADTNVGRLAKWLRVLGYDTLMLDTHSDDNHLVRLAFEQGRVILTKDSHILRRRIVTEGHVHAVFIQDDDVDSQLRQVVSALGLDADIRAFSRCIECNHTLEPRARDQVEGQVPPYVFRTQQEFAQCPQCQRVYWQGTHWQRMRREVESLAKAK
ncbi:MAG: Mut7-C RNAse domain-containing protein [Chloroflexi bacterium]|nr:Mut7-C RNAse domain-containing protein [Chloroflexota bacterium]